MMQALAANFVITMAGEVHAPGWVGFDPEAGTITEVQQGEPPREIETFRGGPGSILLPGLISAHNHLSLGELRSFGHEFPFWSWIGSLYPTMQEHAEDAAYWRRGAERSLQELFSAGVAAVGDNAFRHEGAEALKASRARGVFFHEVFGSLSEDLDAYLEIVRSELEALPREENGLRFGVSPHTPWTCPPAVMTLAAELARRVGRRLSLHLDESREERDFLQSERGAIHEAIGARGHLGRYRFGMSPTALLDELGVLGPDVVAAHCVQVDQSDIECLARSGTHVCHCPTSNLKLAEGIAPVHEMAEAGVALSLGVDGLASSSRLDLFSEMRLAVLLQRGRLGRCARPGPEEALAMATINAARALGIEGGRLEPGLPADLLLLELDPIRHLPVVDPVDSVVFVGEPSMVRLLLGRGRVLFDREPGA